VALLAIALHEATDVAIVLGIVATSVLLGTHNEYRAERTIEALRSRISRRANVLRNGDVVQVDVAELVAHDRVLLGVGDIVPGDLSIGLAAGLECDESALTGESRPVEKRTGDPAYMGIAVCAGSGTGIVVALGDATKYGEIPRHASAPQPRTVFEAG
jgi:P-type Mg2+ transporter